MIEKKKSLSLIPKNLVHEKTRLKQFHLAALSAGNAAEAEKLERQLEQLDELAQGNRERGFSRENEMFLRVNERNRKMNMVEMREAERRDAVERRKNGTSPLPLLLFGGLTVAALSTDMAQVDPFSRRRTIPKTFYDNLVSSRGTSPAPSSGVSTPVMAPKSTPSSLAVENLVLDESANGSKPGIAVNGKNLTVEDVIATADFGIDIEI
jgi:hypothetical protein